MLLSDAAYLGVVLFKHDQEVHANGASLSTVAFCLAGWADSIDVHLQFSSALLSNSLIASLVFQSMCKSSLLVLLDANGDALLLCMVS